MIYLDYNATTSIAPEVMDAMLPYLTTAWGNPSSSYMFGSNLKAVLEKSRGQVAEDDRMKELRGLKSVSIVAGTLSGNRNLIFLEKKA
jgi:cysteine sulfinate desulfinase/cysteine desulfurase-like protein